MTERGLRIAVVGVPGAWSSEALADAISLLTGFRLLIEMSRCVVDLAVGRVAHGGVDLCELDAIIVKKVDRSYGPHMLDQLEILRYVEGRGVRVFSSPRSLLRLVDRLSCSLTLA